MGVEFNATTFWDGLAQLIGVNLVLSGDNAVVIALAARALPPAQQRRAIFWGSGAAVVMRVLLTAVAVEALRLPYLKLVGGALLLWIGVKLLLPEDEGGDEGSARRGASGMLAAIRTILIADLIMSLDNVIAVAAAAKGSLVLLILGLAISIPFVVFGSTLLLRVMSRYPIVIALGAGLLGWVGGEMAVADPLIRDRIEAQISWVHLLGPIGGTMLVLAVG